MSNIILPDKLYTGIVDWKGRPLSHTETTEQKSSGREISYSLPIGGDYRYYKVKADGKWLVGCVKNRPIPRNTISIQPKTAFEMVYGKAATEKGTNKQQWKKVSHNQHGSVIVKETVSDETQNLNTENLPNANDGIEFPKLEKQFEKHNI